MVKSICVFCGSGTGNRPVFAEAAREWGRLMAEHGVQLVYGGSNIGLMGLVSAAARDGGSKVTGVIPQRIAERVPGQDGVDMEVVPGMHERKARMYELADAFVSLPGGIGTLDETFEAWTWNQLGYHAKPVALLNVDGFYDALETFLDGVTERGFLKEAMRSSLIVESNPARLLERLEQWTPPAEEKWA
jgi:uncharacterized protein (TIGR00730 family)